MKEDILVTNVIMNSSKRVIYNIISNIFTEVSNIGVKNVTMLQ